MFISVSSSNGVVPKTQGERERRKGERKLKTGKIREEGENRQIRSNGIMIYIFLDKALL
jgi:hypothetical protein